MNHSSGISQFCSEISPTSFIFHVCLVNCVFWANFGLEKWCEMNNLFQKLASIQPRKRFESSAQIKFQKLAILAKFAFRRLPTWLHGLRRRRCRSCPLPSSGCAAPCRRRRASSWPRSPPRHVAGWRREGRVGGFFFLSRRRRGNFPERKRH